MVEILILTSSIVNWIFALRLKGDMNIVQSRKAKIRTQDARRVAVAIF
jgi:hypothetical protein